MTVIKISIVFVRIHIGTNLGFRLFYVPLVLSRCSLYFNKDRNTKEDNVED